MTVVFSWLTDKNLLTTAALNIHRMTDRRPKHCDVASSAPYRQRTSDWFDSPIRVTYPRSDRTTTRDVSREP